MGWQKMIKSPPHISAPTADSAVRPSCRSSPQSYQTPNQLDQLERTQKPAKKPRLSQISLFLFLSKLNNEEEDEDEAMLKQASQRASEQANEEFNM